MTQPIHISRWVTKFPCPQLSWPSKAPFSWLTPCHSKPFHPPSSFNLVISSLNHIQPCHRPPLLPLLPIFPALSQVPKSASSTITMSIMIRNLNKFSTCRLVLTKWYKLGVAKSTSFWNERKSIFSLHLFKKVKGRGSEKTLKWQIENSEILCRHREIVELKPSKKDTRLIRVQPVDELHKYLAWEKQEPVNLYQTYRAFTFNFQEQVRRHLVFQKTRGKVHLVLLNLWGSTWAGDHSEPVSLSP